MNIIERQETIVCYSIDPTYFEKHDVVERNYSSHSRWQHAVDNVYILNCGISYIALDKATGDQFLQYESRLMLQCHIDEINKDIFEVVKLKEESHKSALAFIKQNSMSFFDKLTFPTNIFSEARIKAELNGFFVMTEAQNP